MRILILNWKDLTHPAAGGAEVYTEEVARQWVREGHQVTLFCASAPRRPDRETVHGVQVVRRGGRYTVYRAARKWYRTLGTRPFDVVIDEVNTRPFLTPRWIKGTPVVALIHQVCKEVWRYEMPLPIALLGRYALEPHWLRLYRNTLVLTVSASSADSLAAYGLRRIQVVPEGIGPLQRPDVPKEAAPTLLFVGRLAGNKRPAEAVAAFKLLRRQLPEARLWILGEGPERGRLGSPDRVTFWGRVDDDLKHELMARAHLLVVTSVREGWGLVVDEAAAMGTPTAAYDVAGLRDSVPAAGGKCTLPTPEALAEVMLDMLSARSSPRAGGAVQWKRVAADIMLTLERVVAGRADATRHSTGPIA
jgi:glycosyltransferase involved in cell wall biosynthesis